MLKAFTRFIVRCTNQSVTPCSIKCTLVGVTWSHRRMLLTSPAHRTSLEKPAILPVVEILEGTWDCSHNEVISIARSCDGILNLEPDELERRLKQLQKYNVRSQQVKKNPWLIGLTPEALTERMQNIRHVTNNIEASITLVSWPLPQLLQLVKVCQRDVKKYPSGHRLLYLTKALKQDERVICEAMAKYKFLLRISFRHVIDVTNVLLHYNVEPADILSDCWILQYKKEKVETQLERVKNGGVKKIKPWMGRCDEAVLNKLLQKVKIKQNLLGNGSLALYLSQQLGCSEKETKEMLDREPQFRNMKLLKMKEILDLLFAHGFTPKQILSSLHRVVKRRFETINQRLIEMKQLSCVPKTVYALGMSKREYERYIKSVKRKKAKQVKAS